MAVPTMSAVERRARLVRRQHLAADAPNDLAATAGDLVGLHASDPVSVYLAAAARAPDLSQAAIADALYEHRRVVRVLGMRRTMFVVPLDLAAVIRAACMPPIAARERRRVVELIRAEGLAADPEGWLAEAERETLAVLEASGEATAAELAREVPALRNQFRIAVGKRYEGVVGLSTRLLFLLAAEWRIMRGRPRGSLLSSQYRWALTDRWLPEPLADWTLEQAQPQLVRRWLRAFGPGRLADIRWWTGWTLGETRRAIDALDVEEVDLGDGERGLVLADDLAPEPMPDPVAALLPGLDPTVMGWQSRDWFLGPHARRLFDTNGNAGPTAWWDGRIVGGWAQRSDGGIAVRLLEDVGREGVAAIDAKAERLRAWLGPIRFTPRFRTPLERELVA